MKALLYARLIALPLLVVVGYLAGGWWNFLLPVIAFGLHPFLNIILKPGKPKMQEMIDEDHWPYRLVELIYLLVIPALSAWSIYTASNHHSPVVFIGLSLSAGLVNGILGFTLAHELLHRHQRFYQAAGYVLLLNNLYMHYGIEHIGGHHRYASTPMDPHTARLGESFYAFFPRAVLGTFKNAMTIERSRAGKNAKINRMIIFIPLQLLFCAALYFLWGPYALLALAIQCCVAISLLHIVNYLQHYGLMRQQDAEGRYEKMKAHHAWNSGNRVKGLSLFQIENHAHHHIHPTHPYEKLKPTETSPQHPTGYSGMILLALVPSLWFRTVHKRILLTA